jgi:ribosomal protein S18 acetylase RimI-like enzyme
LIVRKAKLDDLEQIIDFNIKIAEESEGKILDKNIVRKGVEAILKDETKGFYLVAETKDNSALICGQLMITFEWSDWRNKNIWWIQSVYVDKKYRNMKVFSQLYRTVTKRALSEKNVCGLKLYVQKDNKSAKQVYESLGMKKIPYEIFERLL